MVFLFFFSLPSLASSVLFFSYVYFWSRYPNFQPILRIIASTQSSLCSDFQTSGESRLLWNSMWEWLLPIQVTCCSSLLPVCRIPPSCHLSYCRITLELRNSLCLLKPMPIRTVFSSYCIKFWHFISLKTFVLEQYSMEKRISYSLLQSYRFFVSLKVWRTHYLAHVKQTIILKTIDIK